jgi:catalase
MTRNQPFRPAALRPSILAAILGIFGTLGASAAQPDSELTPPKESPLDMVNNLHTAFGEHHARAVHTKGIMLVGSFTPSKEAHTLVSAPIFAGDTLPLVARFSLFAGVPTLPDNAGPASPSGFGFKITARDGNQYDVAANNHNGFITATVDEFAVFLRAVGASGPGVAHPTPAEQFLDAHPVSKAFANSLTYPESYATATFFGINSFKFTNAKGESAFVRYRFVPRAGEHYLGKDELKAKGENYLQDEIASRVSKEPIVFDWYAQIAEKGDKIEDPSIPWPETHKLVKLGTITLTKLPDDPATLDKRTVFIVAAPHPGIAPADPMLVLRTNAYPISLGQRQ